MKRASTFSFNSVPMTCVSSSEQDMVDMVKNRGRDEEGGLLNPEGGQNHSLEES